MTKMKSYTIDQIKKLDCMKMEDVFTSDDNQSDKDILKRVTRNTHRHQLLEELRGEGKCQ